jgi:hypothetical protein
MKMFPTHSASVTANAVLGRASSASHVMTPLLPSKTAIQGHLDPQHLVRTGEMHVLLVSPMAYICYNSSHTVASIVTLHSTSLTHHSCSQARATVLMGIRCTTLAWLATNSGSTSCMTFAQAWMWPLETRTSAQGSASARHPSQSNLSYLEVTQQLNIMQLLINEAWLPLGAYAPTQCTIGRALGCVHCKRENFQWCIG